MIDSFAPLASSSVVCAKPVFPSRHPVLSVVFMRLSRFLSEIGCQATQPAHGWEMMLPRNIPARFSQQSFTRLPDFSHKRSMLHGTMTETTNQRSVSAKLSDEILCLSCQLEQPACPMILCSFVCGWSGCSSPLCLQSDLSSTSLCFRCAEPLFRSLVQVGFGALAPQLPESLHVSLLHCPEPGCTLPCQDVRHNAVCCEFLRLGLRILEVQINLFHAYNRCNSLFILCKLEDCSNREMCGYASVAHQTNITERVFADTIREHTSILLPGPACT